MSARIMLRLPNSLRDRIEASAQSERRSMNSQIIVLLEQALPAEEKVTAEVAATTPTAKS